MKKNILSDFRVWIAGAVLGVGSFVAFSDSFDKNTPTFTWDNNSYWNLQEQRTITLQDNLKIKNYSVKLVSDNKEEIISSGFNYLQEKSEVLLKLKKPNEWKNEKNVKLVVSVTDNSLWNWFRGNNLNEEINLNIDTNKPTLSILENSYGIRKGGSALVVFKALDDNLENIYLESNNGDKFIPSKFYKDGYYSSLVAWDLNSSDFKLSIKAFDKAGNESSRNVDFYLKTKKYKDSKISLKDNFLDGKIEDLHSYLGYEHTDDKIKRFYEINEVERIKNENLINDLSKNSTEFLTQFDIKPFYPLKNGAAVASFGDKRTYIKNNKKVSNSTHLGIDFASTANAKITTNNNGKVVFNGENGIYGNMLILDHGFGLNTIYGHCSEIFGKVGVEFNEKDSVASTGVTGLALGDHLHFGVSVQGVEVRPEEWMDKKWIKLNITNVFTKSKKIIDSKSSSIN